MCSSSSSTRTSSPSHFSFSSLQWGNVHSGLEYSSYAFQHLLRESLVSLTLPATNSSLSQMTAECLRHEAVVADLGCPTSVVGQNFVDHWIAKHGKLPTVLASRPFGFGAGESVKSHANVDFPLHLGSSLGTLQMHVIPGDLPPLMSKSAIPRAAMVIDTVKDRVTGHVNGVAYIKDLIESSSGHYLVPLE